MALIPDKSKVIFPLEKNVDAKGGGNYTMKDTYDLALYEEMGSGGARAVLEVTMIIRFDFRGTWTAAAKTKFMTDASTEIEKAWSEKHQIVTANPTPPAKVAGVIFDVQTNEWDGPSTAHSHWTVKVHDSSTAFRTEPGGGGLATNGQAVWDNTAFKPVLTYTAKNFKLTTMHRPGIHEFGHMLGLRDEYSYNPSDPWDDPNLHAAFWFGDWGSIMNCGETIMPRHYTILADWISFQWQKKDPVNCKVNDWKVNGTVDKTTAFL
jgi:hypothetical protein